jgi:hypothetical protein
MYLVSAFQTYHGRPGQSAKIKDWGVFGSLVLPDERCGEKLALSLQQREQRSDAEIASGKSTIGSQINPPVVDLTNVDQRHPSYGAID